MAKTLTYTWSGGLSSQDNIGFVMTRDGQNQPWSVSSKSLGNIPNPVAEAIARELFEEAGSATGTCTVTIA